MLDFIANHTPIFYFIQSLWRDEAFSVLISSGSFWQTIRLTSGDFNPPLYYLILNIWMRIFGSSEIAIRSLSLVFHAVFIYFFYEFIKKYFSSLSHYLIIAISLLMFFNPMLLYFAFEARMYSLLVLLSFLSTQYFLEKDWRKHIVFSTLGLYTQPYMIFVLLSQAVFILWKKKKLLPEFITSGFNIFLLYLPWILVILFQIKESGSMWFYPVDFQLVRSVLGNLYLGYEGTPGFLWKWTARLSFILLIFIISALIKTKKKQKDLIQLFTVWLFLPLIMVVGISFIKPIYVNRYVIFTAVPLVFLSFYGIIQIKNKTIRNIFILANIVFIVFFNYWAVPFHKKTDFRKTFMEINQSLQKDDLIVSQTPLSFFESMYYAKDRSKVYLYNPNRQELPSYVGGVLIPKEKWMAVFPPDKDIFLISDNGQYTKIKN